jgi:hypothetical protein
MWQESYKDDLAAVVNELRSELTRRICLVAVVNELRSELTRRICVQFPPTTKATKTKKRKLLITAYKNKCLWQSIQYTTRASTTLSATNVFTSTR